jgi:hypothetical protein
MRRFGEREVMPVMWFGRADKQIILAPVSKPASALKHLARMNRDLQGDLLFLHVILMHERSHSIVRVADIFFLKKNILLPL